MLNLIPTKKEIARSGYITMTSYYKQICDNEEIAALRTVRTVV